MTLSFFDFITRKILEAFVICFVFVYPLAAPMCIVNPYKLTRALHLDIKIKNQTLFYILTMKGVYLPGENLKLSIIGIVAYLSLFSCVLAGCILGSPYFLIPTILYLIFLLIQLIDELVGLDLCREKWVKQWKEEKPCYRCPKKCFALDYSKTNKARKIRKEKSRLRKRNK